MVDEDEQRALEQLSTSNGRAPRVFSTVLTISRSISSQSSTVVSGIVGGFAGLSVAYLLTSLVTALSFFILGLLWCGLGVAAGVLAFRRSATTDAQAQSAQAQIAFVENERIAKAILLRTEKLPPSAPPQVRDELWNDYRMVTRELARLAIPVASKPLSLPPSAPTPGGSAG